MCGVSVATVVEVAGHIGTLDLAAKEKMCDELAAAQPHMLSCVLVLPRLGVPMATVDHVIHVLLVVSECARRASAGRLPEISMAAVEQAAGRINAMLRLLEGESPSQVDRLTRLTVLSHPEQNLQAYVIGYLNEQGLARPCRENEMALVAAKVILDSFSRVIAPDTAADGRTP